MKNLVFFLILCLCHCPPSSLKSQTKSSSKTFVKGRLMEKESRNPIRFAHIFIEGTLVGTTTGENGYFEIHIDANSSKPLIASAIGFESQSFNVSNFSQDLNIYLEKLIYMLDDVEIKADDLPNKRKLRMFESYFLGLSDNAANSEIVNPDDIKLFYDKKVKTLYASSTEPILINNYSLGYKIIYYLKDFEASQNDIEYTGNYFFEELNMPDRKQHETARRRKETYKGSRLHLVRSIWSDQLRKEGFTLFYNNYRKVKLKDISSLLPTGEKVICFNQGVIINYGKSKYNQVHFGDSDPVEKSYVTQIDGCTKIAKDGYYDPTSIRWSGNIAEQRVADLLPYEYSPDKK